MRIASLRVSKFLVASLNLATNLQVFSLLKEFYIYCLNLFFALPLTSTGVSIKGSPKQESFKRKLWPWIAHMCYEPTVTFYLEKNR
jgi:hypothetical protein